MASETETSSKPKLMEQMTCDQLASITKYILESDVTFDKLKDRAMEIKSAFIQHQISGNMLYTESRIQFTKKITTIKRGITAKIYKKLKEMTDNEIEQILVDLNTSQITHSDSTNSGDSKTNDVDAQKLKISLDEKEKEPPNTRNVSIENVSNLSECSVKQMMFILDDILSNHALSEYKEQIIAYFERECVDGKQFLAMKRKDFGNAIVSELNDKKTKGKAVKLYSTLSKYEFAQKPKVQKAESVQSGLSYSEIASIAVVEFGESVRKMLKSMNECMEEHNVNGAMMSGYYAKKEDLNGFLEKNVRRKDVHILTELLWTDYCEDKENKLNDLKEYDRSALLQYFQALYTKHTQSVIVSHKLDANKCLTLKSRGVCNLLSAQCGLSKGACRNIADKIFAKI